MKKILLQNFPVHSKSGGLFPWLELADDNPFEELTAVADANRSIPEHSDEKIPELTDQVGKIALQTQVKKAPRCSDDEFIISECVSIQTLNTRRPRTG